MQVRYLINKSKDLRMSSNMSSIRLDATEDKQNSAQFKQEYFVDDLNSEIFARSRDPDLNHFKLQDVSKSQAGR